MKLISIIVPVYNAENYVEKCIKSILKQTYQNFELILINDGSTDNSLRILKKYEQKDKRIRVIDQQNIGVANTRNKGIRQAMGDYIAFIDNDDYIDVDYLENFIQNSDEVDIIIGGYRRVDMNGKVLLNMILRDTAWAKYTFITPWARIYKREFLLNKEIEFYSSPIGEDIYFNLKAYSSTEQIKIIPYVGYNWLYNDSSISNTVHKGFNEKVDISLFLDKIYNLREIGNTSYIDYYCYKFGIWYLLYSGKNANKQKFRDEYLKIKKWNREHFIKMNIFPFSSKLSGESLGSRCSVFIFTLLDKCHLIGLFSSIYCKGSQ